MASEPGQVSRAGRVVLRKFLPSRARRKRARLIFENLAPRTSNYFLEGPERRALERIRTFSLRSGARLHGLETLFIHIPKTGGSSLTAALRPHNLLIVRSLEELELALQSGALENARHLSLNHLSVTLLHELGLVSGEKWKATAIFAVMRNPFDRAWSAYQHVKARGKGLRLLPGQDFASYIKAVSLKKYFSGLRKAAGLSHGSPQAHWLRGVGNHSQLRILKLEEPEQIGKYLGDLFGVPISLDRRNTSLASEGPPYEFPHLELFTQSFSDDFDLGGYSRNPKDSASFR